MQIHQPPPPRRPSTPQPPARIGLVLGGGGAAGLAFHAGVLWALHHDLGWDPQTADIVVGTSAGSIVGVLLRSGVPVEDLAAWATDAIPSQQGRKFRAVMVEAERTVTRLAVPMPTRPGWHSLNTLRHPSQLPRAMTTMLPHGLFDHSPRMASLERLATTWPSRPLWISAVRVGDGRVEWFGQNRDGCENVAPAQAVAASCAIPIVAKPVRIGDHRYVDGGVKSPTNADVLLHADLDLVLVLSPMGQQAGRNPMRSLADRRVQREAAELRRAGVTVQVLSPDAGTVRAMGHNMMDRNRIGTVMRHAFLGTTSQIDASTTAMLRRPNR
jgi:NTE family protein